MLTWNSGPCGAPVESNRWPKTPYKLPSCRLLSQVTTKSPSASMSTAGLPWAPWVKLLTRDSGPWALPAELKRRANALKEVAAPGSRMVQTTTKSPLLSAATPGIAWTLWVVVLTMNSPVTAAPAELKRRAKMP